MRCDRDVGAPNGCLRLKYYSWRSRSPELGLGPGRAGVRSEREGGPLHFPGLHVRAHSSLWPSLLAARPSGRSECVQGTEISVVLGKLHQGGISWSFLNPWAVS